VAIQPKTPAPMITEETLSSSGFMTGTSWMLIGSSRKFQ
jgi:hypothetical protein